MEDSAPYVPGSPTSAAAAQAIRPSAATLRQQVFDFIMGRGIDGATDEEIQIALGMGGSTERPRRRELQLAGLIVESGEIRPTATGRAATVWVVR
jgi:hypothetical protein